MVCLNGSTSWSARLHHTLKVLLDNAKICFGRYADLAVGVAVCRFRWTATEDMSPV